MAAPTDHQEPIDDPSGPSEEVVLALTLIAHPDIARVGQVVRLDTHNAVREGDAKWEVRRHGIAFSDPYRRENAEPLEQTNTDHTFKNFVSDSRRLCIQRSCGPDGALRVEVWVELSRENPCGCSRNQYHTLYASPSDEADESIDAATRHPGERALCQWLAPVHRARSYTARELEAGVVLMFSRHVGFVLHPWSDFDATDRALSERCSALVGRPLSRAPSDARNTFAGFVGESAALRRVRKRLATAARLARKVLLLGETGTGKQGAAELFHVLSERSGGWCEYNLSSSAHDPAFVGAALFGRADQRQIGLTVKAKGGTLFLDEIGDAPVQVQEGLRKFLDTGHVQPLGGEPSYVETRVVAATNRERMQLIHDLPRRFEQVVELPPLRLRKDDVGRLLVHALRGQLHQLDELGVPPPRGHDSWLGMLARPTAAGPWLSAELVCALASMPLVGNVGELLNLARDFVGVTAESAGHGASAPICDLATCADALEHIVPTRAATSARTPAASANPPRKPALEELSDEQVRAAFVAADYSEARCIRALGLEGDPRAAFRKRRSLVFAVLEERPVPATLEALAALQGKPSSEVCRELRANRQQLRNWLTAHRELVAAKLASSWVLRLHPSWQPLP